MELRGIAQEILEFRAAVHKRHKITKVSAAESSLCGFVWLNLFFQDLG